MTREERVAKEQQITAAMRNTFDAATKLVLHVYDKDMTDHGEVTLTKQRVRTHINQYVTKLMQLYAVASPAGCGVGNSSAPVTVC